MAVSSDRDIKYEERNVSIEDFLRTVNLPAAVRVSSVEGEGKQTEQLEGRCILLQRVSKKQFAHIKVLKLYSSKKMWSETGVEHMSEHGSFVGNEYLMPLTYQGHVRYVRRPGSCGRYLTIKQVIDDCPAFVRVEKETKTHLLGDMKHYVTLNTKAILELKRIYMKGDATVLLDCSDGDKLYTFHENDVVEFTVYERHKLYSLTDLRTALLPKVILFQDIDSGDVVLKDTELRNCLLTIVGGPLEVLGFVDVQYLLCEVENEQQKTCETLLIPQNIWNQIYVQQRCFTSENEKEFYLEGMYRQCLSQDVLSKALYILPLQQRAVTWLTHPNLCKRYLKDDEYEFNEDLTFEDDVDHDEDDDITSHDPIYYRISRPPPLSPKEPFATPKGLPEKTKHTSKGDKTGVTPMTKSHGDKNKAGYKPDKPPKPQLLFPKTDASINERHLEDDNKYLTLNFTKSFSRDYESINRKDNLKMSHEVPGESKSTEQPSESKNLYANLKTDTSGANVFRENQSESDFFQYSVEEVSSCFEYCGFKGLAEFCTHEKLDGSFFKDFTYWNELGLSQSDVAKVNKIIYYGWRPTTVKIGTLSRE